MLRFVSLLPPRVFLPACLISAATLASHVPAAAAEPAPAVEAAFVVRQDWRSGFVGELILQNPGPTPVEGWAVEAEFSFQITGVWGAEYAPKDGRVIFFPASWNRRIEAGGGRVSIGISGQPGYPALPETILFNGATILLQNWSPDATQPSAKTPPPPPLVLPLVEGDEKKARWALPEASVEASLVSAWEEGAQLTWKIFNRTTATWRDWSLSIPATEAAIVSLWNARVEQEGGQRRFAAEQDWNRDISSGQAAEFGFVLGPGGVPSWPEKVTLGGLYRALPPQPETKAQPRPVYPPAVTLEKLRLPKPTPTPTPTPAPEVSPAPAPEVRPSRFTPSDYRRALGLSLLFFEAQRAGRLPENRRVPWRGDAFVNDGRETGIDLSGGYFDAGDHIKFTFPLASTLTLLAWGGVDYREDYESSGEMVALLEAVGWGTDWLLHASSLPGFLVAMVGDPVLDHSRWAPPEGQTQPRPVFWIGPDRPGSDLFAEASAALAASALLFAPYDAAYAEALRQRARELLVAAETHRERYSESVPQVRGYYESKSGYADELAWANVWLYRATGEAGFLARAREIFPADLAGRPLRWTHSWDDKTYGTLLLLAALTGEEGFREKALGWLDFWSGKGRDRILTTSGGLAWLDQWGSLRYAVNTAFLALWAVDYLPGARPEYAGFARRQIDYVLGENPQQFSYLIGFGENFPRRPHHRAAHGSTTANIDDPADNRHVLLGALVGGPTEPRDDAYRDDRRDYLSNEVALDYNAALPGSLARLAAGPPGRPLPPPPTDGN
jgi:endoglucanase